MSQPQPQPHNDAASPRDRDPQQRDSPPTDGWSTVPSAYASQTQHYQDQAPPGWPQASTTSASDSRPS